MSRITRRSALTGGFALVTLTAAGCSGGSTPKASSSSAAPSPLTSHSSTPKPTPVTDPLTGGARSGRPVIAVKLENTQAAMPQYGLSPADLVFVEQVEGNLTRLMPVFQSSYPKRIEPVRSARSTDIDILPMFGRPMLVYSGVASQVRPRLEKAPIVLYSKGSRDSSRPAPHNFYVDIQQASRRPGLRTSKNIGLSFAASDPRVTVAAKATSVTERVGGDRFSFSYNGTHYLPSWNGRRYVDAGAGNKPVTTDNVVVLKVRLVSDGYRDPAGTPVYKSTSTGSGAMTLYRGGRRLTGTWHRAAANKPFRFLDSHGKVLSLAPGKTWILLQA